jgi:hypothetical protein
LKIKGMLPELFIVRFFNEKSIMKQFVVNFA